MPGRGKVAQPDSHQEITWLEKSLINMSNLPKYYFLALARIAAKHITIQGKRRALRAFFFPHQIQREKSTLLAFFPG
jgi:hypothetical protein